MEAETPDGSRHSIMLQNAETVRLVGPTPPPPCNAATAHDSGSSSGRQLPASSGSQSPEQSAGYRTAAWRVVSVSQLAVGDTLCVLRQGGARHTGIRIQETCTER